MFYDKNKHKAANNYFILLLAQVFTLLMPAVFEYLKMPAIAAGAFTLVIFVSAYIVTDTKRQLLIATGLGLVTAGSMWLGVLTPGDFWILEGNVAAFAFFCYAGIKLGQKIVASTHKVNINALFAAISGFIFLGLTGGFLIDIVDLTSEGAYNVSMATDGYINIYYSFVTITTLGYGDVLPVSPTAQAISVILAIAGQMYITVVIAVIVGKLISESLKD